MKKLIAFLMALTVCSLAFIAVGAAPSGEEGTVYDLHADFGKESYLENSAYSFGARKLSDKTMITDIDWIDGSDDSVIDSAYGSSYVGYKVKDLNIIVQDTTSDDGNDYHFITWYPDGSHENVVIFTAPESGTYSYEFEVMMIWGCDNSAIRFYVEADGAVHNGNDVTYEKGTAKADTRKTFTGSVELEKGETIYFINNPVDGPSGDNAYIVKLVTTLDEKKTQQTPPVTPPVTPVGPSTEEGSVYDLHNNFGKADYLDGSAYSFAARKLENNSLITKIDWIDGSDDSVIDSAYGSPYVGYKVKDLNIIVQDTTSDDGNDYHFITWYPDGAHENVVIFTAPTAGTYSYEFEVMMIWGCDNSAIRFYVEADGGVHNGNDVTYAKGTAKADTRKTFTGTVELEKGETIYFINNPVDGPAGDNAYIVKLITTLDEKAVEPVAPPSNPSTPTTPSAPATLDHLTATVIMAVTAACSVAIVIKKVKRS